MSTEQISPANVATRGVLIIDDDPAITEFLKSALDELFSVDLYVAATGPEARLLWQNHFRDFVAILSDVSLGNETGTTLVRELTVDAPDLPVIFMTGHGCLPDEIAHDLGRPVRLLYKPFSLADLCSAFPMLKSKLDIDDPA